MSAFPDERTTNRRNLDRVYCPACKKDVIIKNNISVACPSCKNRISELFEKELSDFLLQKWNVLLRPKIVTIRDIRKKFDLVSDNMNLIGDAKFYKSLPAPTAKWSTIAEYVWLLQFTAAKHKFLIFGRDKSVPQRWLDRYRSLVGETKLYFFDHKNIELQTLT